jgi:hypothetical protein
MMILSLIAAVAVQPELPRGGVAVQATASVRIISGKRVTLGTPIAEAELRQTRVRDVDGQPKSAQLIEFQ